MKSKPADLPHLADAPAEDKGHGGYVGEVAEIEKRRVTLALELQRTNRDREVLREKIVEAGGSGFLSTDGVDLLGLGDVHDDIQWAASRLVADGICSRAEIENARLGKSHEGSRGR